MAWRLLGVLPCDAAQSTDLTLLLLLVYPAKAASFC
jgi:hypothetical protein